MVVDVTWAERVVPAGAEWRAGPLTARWIDGTVADRERRMTYFEPRIAASLYGTPGRPSRWHRHGAGSGRVRAVELLRAPKSAGGGGLAVLHVTLGEDALAQLPEIGRPAFAKEELAGLLPLGVTVAEQARRPWVLSHVTFAGGRPPTVLPGPEYADWSPRDQWLWLLASATPFDRFPPDPQDASLFAGRVRFSADWQALVLRDGTAFLGTSPDPGGDSTFHAAAARLVHTLYLDVFLLGRLQLAGTNALANTLAALRAPQADAARLQQYEERLIELRRTLWSTHITAHGKANELLEKFQDQHRMPQLAEFTANGLADAARYVEATRARRSGIALGLLSAVGLPFGLAYGAGALWGEPSPDTFALCTVIAMAVTVVLFALLPPLRSGAAEALRRPED
ncbi:hypothetical protein DY218_13990 [Streptomyces triticagri]|uniref:CorA-like Mg2+ transporter protein n=1 Tax=Streptomyces triticagri TaxID=2293568 RepID=A0A372M641_9ACTN|nr:hypothetical protein DY218_13990 [Streptomyces triticagri]